MAATTKALLAGLGAAATGFFVFSIAKAKSGTAPPTQRVEDAIRTGEPTTMREEATKLSNDGFQGAADDLMQAADTIEQTTYSSPGIVEQTAANTGKSPTIVLEEIVISAGAVARTQAAEDLKLHLLNHPKGSEDRNIVKAAQTAMGELVIDGLYGPKTALRMASFGVIPPKPYYWPADPSARIAYSTKLREYADADPARRELWLKAAMV